MNMESIKNNRTVFDRWMPREQVKKFFGYGQTKMSTFSKDNDVRCRKIGNKLFYYADDVERLLEPEIADEK